MAFIQICLEWLFLSCLWCKIWIWFAYVGVFGWRMAWGISSLISMPACRVDYWCRRLCMALSIEPTSATSHATVHDSTWRPLINNCGCRAVVFFFAGYVFLTSVIFSQLLIGVLCCWCCCYCCLKQFKVSRSTSLLTRMTLCKMRLWQALWLRCSKPMKRCAWHSSDKWSSAHWGFGLTCTNADVSGLHGSVAWHDR